MKNLLTFSIGLLFYALSSNALSAQIVCDNNEANVEYTSPAQTITINNFNVPANDNVVLIVATYATGRAVNTIDFNGTTYTMQNYAIGVQNQYNIFLLSLWAIPLGDIGTAINNETITINLQGGSTNAYAASAVTFHNVDQADPTSSLTTNGFVVLNNIPANPNDVAFDAIFSSSTTPFAPYADQTLLADNISTAASGNMATSYKPISSGTTTSMNWTSGATGVLLHAAFTLHPAAVVNCGTTGTDVVTACDSYTWIDGNTYTANNDTATYTLTNAAGCDSIVTLDLTINSSSTGTDVVTACDSYVWIDGNTYTASNNTATYTLNNVHGCDSVVTLNLTINNSNTGTDVITSCDSYTWIDGNTYTTSNNSATYILTNAAGCDSIVTLDLTINYSTTGTDVITACDSYSWIDGNTYTSSNNTATYTLTNAVGCDSLVTLDLTINNSTTGTDVISACDSYTWIDGNTYTESNNTATYTLTNVAGCDSVVTLDLTINTVDVSVIENGITLTANLAGASYQWIDCNDNNNPIAGETNQSYTATADGSYAVIVDDGNCVGTSICYAVIGVDAEAIKEAAVNIYPNPTNGIVFVQGEGIEKIVVTDVNGRVIEQVITSQQQVTLDLTGNVQGIYFVNIETKNGRIIRKILLK